MGFGIHAAVFMGMTNPAVGATQFTACVAMSNVCITYSNVWMGRVGERFDYSTVLSTDAAIIIISLAMIPFLRDREDPIEIAAARPA